MALKLKRLGIERVRPLLGGLEAWRDRSFPLVPWESSADADSRFATLRADSSGPDAERVETE